MTAVFVLVGQHGFIKSELLDQNDLLIEGQVVWVVKGLGDAPAIKKGSDLVVDDVVVDSGTDSDPEDVAADQVAHQQVAPLGFVDCLGNLFDSLSEGIALEADHRSQERVPREALAGVLDEDLFGHLRLAHEGVHLPVFEGSELSEVSSGLDSCRESWRLLRLKKSSSGGLFECLDGRLEVFFPFSC